MYKISIESDVKLLEYWMLIMDITSFLDLNIEMLRHSNIVLYFPRNKYLYKYCHYGRTDAQAHH